MIRGAFATSRDAYLLDCFKKGEDDTRRLIKWVMPYNTHKERAPEEESREIFVKALLERAERYSTKDKFPARFPMPVAWESDVEYLPLIQRGSGRLNYIFKCNDALNGLMDLDINKRHLFADWDRVVRCMSEAVRCFLDYIPPGHDGDPGRAPNLISMEHALHVISQHVPCRQPAGEIKPDMRI